LANVIFLVILSYGEFFDFLRLLTTPSYETFF
jgi:hypothetical protein